MGEELKAVLVVLAAVFVAASLVWSGSTQKMRQQPQPTVKFLTQEEAKQVDVELMDPNKYAFLEPQLMEIAGLASAQAVEAVWPLSAFAGSAPRVLVVAGPGNNGGDGLVAARHLFMWGYNVTILYPKQPQREPLPSLMKQCEAFGIPFVKEMPSLSNDTFDIVLDAIFGYSYKGPMRQPFVDIIKAIASSGIERIASIDVPSGWDVEKGDLEGFGMPTELLISLTAPKKCAELYKGAHHFLGGRFVPNLMAKEMDLCLPAYEGSSQIARL